MNAAAQAVIDELGLTAHPEGGYYREIFRSPLSVTDRRGRTRSALTVIYFLLADEDVSAWHRLGSDEMWHFARGAALEIAVLAVDGTVATQHIGPGGPYVAVIPAERPFAARIASGSGYALVSCCVAPGFEFDDFELLDTRKLALEHPAMAGIITLFEFPTSLRAP